MRAYWQLESHEVPAKGISRSLVRQTTRESYWTLRVEPVRQRR
jgi:hypothetical protein